MTMLALACESSIRAAVEAAGCRLWEACNTPGRSRHVTVLIDKEGGVSTEDCEKVMDQLQHTYAKLDNYLKDCAIDVASPGVDRSLRHQEHYRMSLYKLVDIKGHQCLTEDNKKSLRGYLIACDDLGITVECENSSSYVLPYSAIAKCRWLLNTTPYNREKA